MAARMTIRLPAEAQARLDAAAAKATAESWAARLFERDTTLWTNDGEAAEAIAGRLGWLDAPAHFALQAAALEGFGDGAREAGFDTAVVMGMGGSSLAPDILHRTFGTIEGYLGLRILDSTDPAAVAATVDDLDPLETLWIVASKSGTTTEPLAFMADAWARVEAALDERGSDQRPGEFFAVITDPGKSLDAIPHHDELRERFLNPPDVGGRYSALTYVGLAPASLIGIDIDALLETGAQMLDACRTTDAAGNPGLLLGLTIGSLARDGRDKLTFLADDAISSFGAWAEQLLAESTGKHGTGIVPVDLEPVRAAAAYGTDRAFVDVSLSEGDGGSPGARKSLLDALEAAGHPVIRIELDDPIDLAGEAIRWEIATAFAGAVLGIDPFDQPNVEEAKERTRRVLGGAAEGGDDGSDQGAIFVRAQDEASLADSLRPTLRALAVPSYLGIQAFIAPSPAVDERIAGIRQALAATGCATTAGYGPRFLHSTGQLHKGGPATGVFLQLTADHPVDRPIPGWPYTFGRLIDAQARGDREALRAHDRTVVQVHLGDDLADDLAILERAVRRALA
ncbi:MAG TPA: glucose-6-phosphate isomerase [Patescibacteria group bacterium]|nr:glucose-6-phosphate isomerase [Patescibacteria group bacterium]